MQYLLVLIFVACVASAAQGPEWLAERQSVVEEVKTGNLRNLDSLAVTLNALGGTSDMSPEEELLVADARNEILSIPNYSEYFSKRLDALSGQEIEGKPLDPDLHIRLYSKRHFYFHISQNLPAPDSVRCLADYLSDERDPWKDLPASDGGVPFPTLITRWFR